MAARRKERKFGNMSTTRNIGLAVATAALMLAAVADLHAAPPESLTVGGAIAPAPDGMSSTGAVWRLSPIADTTLSVTGTVGSLAADVWAGDIGALADSIPVGSVCLVIVESVASDN